MTAMTIDRRDLPIIDPTAIHLGTTLIAWGRRRASRLREFEAVDSYRTGYADRVRTASALVQQRLLP